MGVRVAVEVSPGELLDRITILELKLERLPVACRGAVRSELAAVRAVRDGVIGRSARVRALTAALRAVNSELWDVEEALRRCEERRCFDQRFVRLARSVYRANDRRAALKRRVNQLLESDLVEHKSHALPDV